MKRLALVSFLLGALLFAGCSESKPNGGQMLLPAATGKAPDAVERGPVTVDSLLTPDHFAAVRLNIQGTRNSPLVQSLPPEFLAELAGFDLSFVPVDKAALLEVNAVWFMIGPMTDSSDKLKFLPVNALSVTEFASPQALDKALLWELDKDASERVMHDGQEYYNSKFGGSFWILDGRFLCYSLNENRLKAVIDQRGIVPDTPLAKKMQDFAPEAQLVAAVSLDPLREFIASLPKDELPSELQPYADAPDYIDSFALALDLDGPTIFKGEIVGVDAEKAGKLRQLVNTVVGLGKQWALSAKAELEDSPFAASAMPLHGIADEAVNGVQTSIEGRTVTVSVVRPESLAKLPEIVEAMQADEGRGNRRTP